MSKIISEIYKEYKIVPSLQEHMFRVAAVGYIICDNISLTLDKKEILTACLLHDMGNIIKFNMDVMPELLEPEGIEYWQKVKDEYVKKYGENEYIASTKIAEEIGVSKEVVELIASLSFFGAANIASGDDFRKKIIEYADQRVDPFGIVSMEERFIDLRKRYARFGEDTPERLAFENDIRKMEQQIFAKCKIKPEDINNETVAPIITELKNFVIK